VNLTSQGSAIICFLLLIAGCATSMTPIQFNEQLPKVTIAKFYDRVSVEAAISEGQCRLLIANRKYTAPIGMTISGDLMNGAREPPRELRRLQILREWSHEQDEEVFT
jgi:hypothetical protein